MIRIERITFRYADGRAALKDIIFEVAAGETVGVIGPNGAGKSTLLLNLNGVLGLPRQEGRIEVAGLELTPAQPPGNQAPGRVALSGSR